MPRYILTSIIETPIDADLDRYFEDFDIAGRLADDEHPLVDWLSAHGHLTRDGAGTLPATAELAGIDRALLAAWLQDLILDEPVEEAPLAPQATARVESTPPAWTPAELDAAATRVEALLQRLRRGEPIA